jgi:REP element-mobilizing transposase RayT
MLASRYNIRVLKVCLMYDHIHISVIAPDKETLSTFVGEYSRLFAHEYNVRWGLSGKLFCSPFGRADKREAKAIRTNLIYVDNNPVERHIVKKGEQSPFLGKSHTVKGLHPSSGQHKNGRSPS